MMKIFRYRVDLRDVLTALMLAAVIALFQCGSGAYQSDFSADEDEAAHVVSSLMVRDYLVHAPFSNPLRFAEAYYIHYPKVAIGHWPPLFHASEAIWMILFGRSRLALLLFVAANAFALALAVYAWVKRDCGHVIAALSALALLSPLFMQRILYSVEPDMLLGLFAFCAAFCYGEYLEHRRARDVALFGALTCAAMLVHGRGASIAFLPLTAAVLRQGARTSKRLWAGLAAAMLALAVLPSLLGQSYTFTPWRALKQSVDYVTALFVQMGFAVAAVALIGAIAAMRSKNRNPRWLAVVALLVGNWVFHSLILVPWMPRYQITTVPAIAALFGLGCWEIVTKASRLSVWPRSAVAAAGLAAAVLTVLDVMPIARKPDLSYHRWVCGGVRSMVSLVSGDAFHEGAMISEMALCDQNEEHIVLRASKVLFSGGWSGQRYSLRFTKEQDIAKYLENVRVETIIEQQNYEMPHDQLLLTSLRSHPADWQERRESSQPPGTRFFSRISELPARSKKLSITLFSSSGMQIKWTE